MKKMAKIFSCEYLLIFSFLMKIANEIEKLSWS